MIEENELIQFGESHKEKGMTSLEIAKVTKKRHTDILRDIRSLLERGASERNFALTSYNDKQGKSRPMFKLTPKGCLILASGYDVVLRESIIDKLEEYREREKKEELAERIKQQSLIDQKLKVASWLTDYLNLSNVSKLTIAKDIAEPFGLPIPDYVESKGVYHSASFLLKENGAVISSQAFNKLALANGYLVKMSRPSKKGNKEFWVITEKGAEYGENTISPENPKETQPNWYDNKFNELLKKIGVGIQQNIF